MLEPVSVTDTMENETGMKIIPYSTRVNFATNTLLLEGGGDK